MKASVENSGSVKSPVPYSVGPFDDTIICGNSWEVADTLPAAFIQCLVTSPPYFGHRVYAQEEVLVPLEFGRETNVKDYVNKLTALFAKLRPCLKESGTLWLNLGDTYRDSQLLGVPWRTAIALQDDGWILRSEVIWNKSNAMPSSVRNRPTTSHEHIFLFSNSTDYYYDADAIREPHVTFSEQSRMKGAGTISANATVRPKTARTKAIITCTTDDGIRRSTRSAVTNAPCGIFPLANSVMPISPSFRLHW